jgi:hypothetical protein
MATFVCVNASTTARDNVNAGGEDIAAGEVQGGVTLTAAELIAFSAHDFCFALGEAADFTVTDGQRLKAAYLLAETHDVAEGDGTADGSVINDAGDPGMD